MAGRALGHSWPPFALVGGLLAIGFLANEDGLFRWAGARLAALPGSIATLLVVSMLLVAAVTAVFNLDTSVVFLTPMLVHVARSRGADELPFLYGVVLMSNSASLLLPGSNLTNLLVLGHGHTAGVTFASRMAPAFVASVAVTIGMLVFWHRRRVGRPREPEPVSPAFVVREGTVATIGATILILALRAPALPVLILGVGACVARAARSPLPSRAIQRLDPLVIGGLFGVVVGFGTLARVWAGPSHLIATTSPWATGGIGALTSIAVNNLPAATLLAARASAHPRALLVGLNLGPNLAVTGSLSALLWFRAASTVDAEASARTYSRIGIPVALLAGGAALLALRVFNAGPI